MTVLDLTGQEFGHLTVLTAAPQHRRHGRWHCLCVCGGAITAYTDKLRNGRTSSCGCRGRRYGSGVIVPKPKKLRSGPPASSTPTYRSWTAMRDRCGNPNRPNYKYYGGRGITIHPGWDSFTQFLADMGPRPEGATLDRINGDGPYEPGNCRWADRSTQNRNRRAPVKPRRYGRLSVEKAAAIRRAHSGGRTQASLAAEYGVSTATIWGVITGRAWKQVA